MQKIVSIVIALLVLGLPAAGGSEPEYTLLPLGTVPDGYINSGTGLNNAGQVVGWSQFYGNDPGSKAWIWNPESGYSLLPPAPGMTSYRAIDINDSGVIAGDGGYDSGESWRYSAGNYEVLGTLEGDPISWTSGINEQGDVSGTSRGLQLAVPHKPFLDTASESMLQILSSADSGYLNDVGQVVGWSQSNAAFRYSPDSGVEFLEPLATHPMSWAFGINNHGTVVGEAAHANGNAHIPFIYDDLDGMRPIGSFGGGAGAASINDAGQVVGNFSTGGDFPWIWTRRDGVRFLQDLVDAPDYRILSAKRINQAGQILVRLTHLPTFTQQPGILLPTHPAGEARISFMTDGETIDWDAVPGATGYSVYRGEIAGLVDTDGDLMPDGGYGECMNASDPTPSDTVFADPDRPLDGTGFFYLVACVDLVGDEFGLGDSSRGVPRAPSVHCP